MYVIFHILFDIIARKTSSGFCTSVVDLHRFNGDPDPGPTFHFDADPDPDSDLTNLMYETRGEEKS